MTLIKIEDRETYFKRFMEIETLEKFSVTKALQIIGHLIDTSFYLKRSDGIKRAIKLSDELQERNLSPKDFTVLQYFKANDWSDFRGFRTRGNENSWEWEQNEFEQEIICRRLALRSEGFKQLAKRRQCELLTNIANLFSEIGRIHDAIEFYDTALVINPKFGMALGNRGFFLTRYAYEIYDVHHKAIILKHAHSLLRTAIDFSIYPEARQGFQNYLRWIEERLTKKFLRSKVDMSSYSLGRSKQERYYRRWCLHNRLFLNPLNDIGNYSIAAKDVLTLPNIVTDFNVGPNFIGLYNYLKQEFVSARYLYFSGITSMKCHFSDRNVLLLNTLDYPSYGIATENIKMGFRILYSILDKIAFFINSYFDLRIPENEIYFRSIWYKDKSRKNGIRNEFLTRENWCLRGLFWLGKDLFYDVEGFRQTIEPDAQEITKIRNYLEHKYLKLHELYWVGPEIQQQKPLKHFEDSLAYSLYKDDFEKKTLRLMKMVRSALILLSLSVHQEEKIRAKQRGENTVTIPIRLDHWDDKWKV